MTIIEYDNGNCHVSIDTDTGTKTRECGGYPKPEFPESVDLKITDRCDRGCAYCHESSSPDGDHSRAGTIQRLINGLPPGVEIAVGGGNALTRPDLQGLLWRLRARGLIGNVTLHIDHAVQDFTRLKTLRATEFVKGVGLSGAGNFAGIIEQIVPGLIDSNTVLHFVAGVDSVQDLRTATYHDYKILILGYKQRGRGKDYYGEKVENNLHAWRYFLPSLLRMSNLTISFDNLALDQLDVKSRIPEDVWRDSYMGDDGQFSMFVDAVTMEYAASSSEDKRLPLGDMTIREAFANARPPEDAERSMPFDGLFDSLGHDTDCDCEWCRQ